MQYLRDPSGGLGAGTLPAFFHCAFTPLPRVKEASSALETSLLDMSSSGGRPGVGVVRVTAVEIDADVAAAAEQALGLEFNRRDMPGTYSASSSHSSDPKRRRIEDGTASGAVENSGFDLVIGDAAEYLAAKRTKLFATLPGNFAESDSLDCIMMDAYDGSGQVPAHLQRAPFLVRPAGLCLFFRPNSLCLIPQNQPIMLELYPNLLLCRK